MHDYSEPVSIDTDVASGTSEQVGDPSSSNSGGIEQMEPPMEQPEYENPEHHASPEIVLRRSRNRKLPSRFTDYVVMELLLFLTDGRVASLNLSIRFS